MSLNGPSLNQLIRQRYGTRLTLTSLFEDLRFQRQTFLVQQEKLFKEANERIQHINNLISDLPPHIAKKTLGQLTVHGFDPISPTYLSFASIPHSPGPTSNDLNSVKKSNTKTRKRKSIGLAAKLADQEDDSIQNFLLQRRIYIELLEEMEAPILSRIEHSLQNMTRLFPPGFGEIKIGELAEHGRFIFDENGFVGIEVDGDWLKKRLVPFLSKGGG